MGRKTQITKEQILEAGLQIILREGHQAVTIKTVAKELHCSTQPISWSFGNIDNYYVQLMQYALKHLKDKMLENEKGPLDYRKTSETYIKIAAQEPNLIRYLFSDKEALGSVGGIGIVFDDTKNALYVKQWALQTGISEDKVLSFMQYFVTFTDGIVSLILAGLIPMEASHISSMLDDAEKAYKTYLATKN